jgi:hypothetical protein
MTQPTAAIPAGMEVITPPWLTEVLCASDAIESDVVDVRIEAMSVASAAGDLARIHVVYRDGDTRGPESLIAKARGSTEVKRAMDAAMDLAERERFVYAELAADLPVALPRCHHAGGGEPDTPMLLEDLRDLRAGDQVEGLGPHDAERLAELLADLHATYWNSELPGGESGRLLSLADPAIGAMLTQLVTSGIPVLFERYGAGQVPQRILEALADAAPRWAEVVARCTEGPATFVHNDFRLDNIFFRPDGEPVVIDWQLAGRSRGTQDLAYLLAGSMAQDALAQSWQQLLEMYHQRLVARGVRGYSLEQCRDHYRQSLLYTLAPGIALLGQMQIVGDERDLADVFIRRTFRHADDLDAFATV